MKQPCCLFFAVVVLLSGSLALLAQAEPVRGAIFTTLSDGSAVNANQYESKCAVYLDGGPGPNAPARAAGLPDGDYYFQVTDPSGKQLLSTDPVSDRSFRVANGVIVTYTGFSGSHPTGVDRDHSELGAITIGLANTSCPVDFLDSPNNGGAYKVWATPVNDFVGNPANVDNECGNGCFHGFVPSKSKTDNFKAKAGTATFCLTVQKVCVASDNSFFFMPSSQFTLTDPLGTMNTYSTDVEGRVQLCGLVAGGYTVAQDVPETILILNGVPQDPKASYSLTWTAGKPAPVLLFQSASSGGCGGQPQ